MQKRQQRHRHTSVVSWSMQDRTPDISCSQAMLGSALATSADKRTKLTYKSDHVFTTFFTCTCTMNTVQPYCKQTHGNFTDKQGLLLTAIILPPLSVQHLRIFWEKLLLNAITQNSSLKQGVVGSIITTLLQTYQRIFQ